MRFIVSKTSQWDDEVPPCPEAVKVDVIQHGYFTFKTVAEANKRYPDKVFEKDTEGVRTVGVLAPAWVVDLATIDDLMAFYARHGRVVIGPWWRNYEIPEIEIYDGYRE